MNADILLKCVRIYFGIRKKKYILHANCTYITLKLALCVKLKWGLRIMHSAWRADSMTVAAGINHLKNSNKNNDNISTSKYDIPHGIIWNSIDDTWAISYVFLFLDTRDISCVCSFFLKKGTHTELRAQVSSVFQIIPMGLSVNGNTS